MIDCPPVGTRSARAGGSEQGPALTDDVTSDDWLHLGLSGVEMTSCVVIGYPALTVTLETLRQQRRDVRWRKPSSKPKQEQIQTFSVVCYFYRLNTNR